jgi:hypothetical protein
VRFIGELKIRMLFVAELLVVMCVCTHGVYVLCVETNTMGKEFSRVSRS